MLLTRLGIKRTGRKIVNTGVAAANDFTACIALINKEIKRQYPKKRQDWTIEEFKEVTASLDDILATLTTRYKGILDGKKR